MTRDYALTNVTIWQDSDWRNLPFPAQYLYQMLWTHPSLNYCGVTDWRPARLTALGQMLSADLISDLCDTLQARYFVVPDPDTEEVLLRSYVRWDGLMRRPRMAISWVKAYAATASNTLRGVVVSEGRKLRDREPGLACWEDPRVVGVLRNEAIDARDLPTPTDPFTAGLPPSLRGVCDAFVVNGTGRLRSPTTTTATATATATASSTKKYVAGKIPSRASALPPDWSPNATHENYANEHGLDLDHEAGQFRAHHLAKGSTFRAWDQAFRTWLGNQAKWQAERRGAKPTNGHTQPGLGYLPGRGPGEAQAPSPPAPPEDIPGELYRAWNLAHVNAWRRGLTGPTDWRQLVEGVSA